MSVAFCQPHKERGFLRAAARVENGIPQCQSCLDGKDVPARTPKTKSGDDGFAATRAVTAAALRVGVHAPEKETANMRGKRTDIDWARVQARRDDGERVVALAREFHCDVSLIYAKTISRKQVSDASGAFGLKREAARPTSANGKALLHANGAETITTSQLIAALEERRDAYSRAIAALKGIGL